MDLLWGVAALTNPSVLTFLPFSGLWLVYYQLYRRKLGFLLPVAVAAGIFWLDVLLPWQIRNYEVLHKLVFIRATTPPLKCVVRNNPPGRRDLGRAMYHPSQNFLLFQQYKQIGESAYAAEQGRLAKQWISEHPQKVRHPSPLRKFIFFWADIPATATVPDWMVEHNRKWASRAFHPVVFREDGTPRLWLTNILQEIKPSLFLATSLLAIGGLLLAIKRRVHGIYLFASLLAFYPLIYYFAFPQPRYRHPIEPELLILGVYLVTEARPRPTEEKAKALALPDQSETLPTFHTLSIIIPVYNERRTVMKLLKQVAAQPISLHKELVIVDYYSTDGTREFLAETGGSANGTWR